jgi:hypothetical protein
VNKIFLLVFTLIISKNKEQNVKGLFLLNELSKPAANIFLSEKIVKLGERNFYSI